MNNYCSEKQRVTYSEANELGRKYLGNPKEYAKADYNDYFWEG